jgi:membrane carboxypeptidase/penicillin-binding protein
VGYTPELVTAVWVGYDDNAPTRLTGASAALPVWVGIMRPWLGDGTDSQFDLPPGGGFCNIDPGTGGLANSTCPDIEQAAYVEGTAPLAYCSLHSPSFGDRWDRVWGRDSAQPESSSPPRKRSLVGWLRDTFSL